MIWVLFKGYGYLVIWREDVPYTLPEVWMDAHGTFPLCNDEEELA